MKRFLKIISITVMIATARAAFNGLIFTIKCPNCYNPNEFAALLE